MERFRKIKFQHLLLLYSLCLLLVFILAATLFLVNMQIDVPEQMQGYYVSVDGTVASEQGLTIPWGEFHRRVIAGQEIHTLFAPYYVSAIIRATLIAFLISLLLSFVFAYILTRRIVKPIEATANSLKYIGGKNMLPQTAFPKELSEIESAFREVREETARLYADFENLSAFLSHDQKNSLALLRATIQNECPAAGASAIAQLDRMVNSLDDILTLSTNEIKLEKVDLLLICGMAADEYKRIYPAISFDFDEDAALSIAGHELLLYRAISNLIDNAMKYGENKPIKVYVGSQGGCPYVSVEDQGIGISGKQQEKIFESRYRIGNRKKDGYGIGLSLVRHVAGLCGGFVWVDSQENHGSKFKLVFPAFTQD